MASTAVAAAVPWIAMAVQAEPAGELRIDLVWQAPAGCPEQSVVRAGVGALLAGSTATVTARAEVAHVGDSWRVLVFTNGGERHLEASSCRAIAEVTELIVAMAVDPARVAANRAGRPVVDAGAEAAIAVVPLPAEDAGTIEDAKAHTFAPEPTAALAEDASGEPAIVPRPRAESSPTSAGGPLFALSVGPALDLGTLPSPAAGGVLGFAWTPSPIRVELSGSAFLPDSTSLASGTGAIERFRLLTANASVCGVASPGRFEVGPCVLGEVASVHGEGLGILHPQTGSSGWVAPGGGVFGAVGIARSWSVLGRADALIPTIRPRFQVDGQTLHQPSAVTGRLSIGAELRF